MLFICRIYQTQLEGYHGSLSNSEALLEWVIQENNLGVGRGEHSEPDPKFSELGVWGCCNLTQHGC